MADNTIIQQGTFTSTGAAVTLSLRSDVDWMRVWNYTQAAAQQAAGRGVEFYWQRGMAVDTGLEYQKTNNTDALNLVTLATGGFTLVDTSTAATVGALNVTVTAVDTGLPPLVNCASTAGLSEGDVVRMINILGATQIGGIDFTLDNLVTNTQFDLAYMVSIVAGTTGGFRRVNYDPMYYPTRRTISSISLAASAVVIFTVTHGYTVGQEVRFSVPSEYAMTEINGLLGTITAIDTTTNSITVDIDSTAFTTFAWPLTAVGEFTHAHVTPVGMAAEETYVNLLDDATRNTAVLGMILEAGAQSPAGSTNDVIYWTAGKSFSNLT